MFNKGELCVKSYTILVVCYNPLLIIEIFCIEDEQTHAEMS